MKRVEILAPAGDMESLCAAIANGADAVYFGLDLFNARIRAKNFTLENIGEAVRLCHAHGVRAYVTLNTQIYNRELPLLLEYVGKIYESGADALIVADFGVASLIKEHYPDFEIHASTQASVHNLDGANLLSSTLGFSRVVLARELDKESIEYVSKNAEAETEIFVHGAHCMSVSGQCLASYCMGGRSGNRGECAQPCRLPYKIGGKESYPLSLKDMTLSCHISELLNSGASSFKIEGRMKNGLYVGGTVKIWRHLIDQNRSATKDELSTLGALFSRGGFTDGYFIGKINSSMLGIRSDKDKEITGSIDAPLIKLEKSKISLEAEFFLDRESKLTIIHGDRRVTVYGDKAEKAINSPITTEELKKNLIKFGTTPFEVEHVLIKADEGIMIRNSSINALRRKGVEALFDMGRKQGENSFVPKKADTPLGKIRTAVFRSVDQIPGNYSYFDVRFVPLEGYAPSEKVNGVLLPPVIFDGEWDKIEGMLARAKDGGAQYALVSNIGQVKKVKELGLTMVADYRFNVFNTYTLSYLLSLGFSHVILSPELSCAQLRDFSGHGIIAYGKLPIMTTHKCVIKDTYGCDRCEGYIKDRQGAELFVHGVFGHRNMIYNSVPIYMADKQRDISQYSYHFIFSDEKKEQAEKIIEAYKKELPTGVGIKRIK